MTSLPCVCFRNPYATRRGLLSFVGGSKDGEKSGCVAVDKIRVRCSSDLRAVHVAGVARVVDATGLHHEVVAVVVLGQELDGRLCHLRDGRLEGVFALGEAVVIVAQVARGEQTQDLALAGRFRLVAGWIEDIL